MPAPYRYRSPEEDSARWLGFPLRDGDIVISTRSKSGTTWMQMICALLVFQDPVLPAPLGELSPWLDWVVESRESVYRRLTGQEHRRFVKTHTPLDGLPLDSRATYIVVARHPLDMAVSLYHQGDNLDRARIRELTGQVEPEPAAARRPSLTEWLLDWMDADVDPRHALDSLPGVLWHLSDAWSRRHEPNVVLIHYDDLRGDLAGEMRKLASRLDIDVPDARWPQLAEAATFVSMRSRARLLIPDTSGILKEPGAFFRSGTSGSGRRLLGPDERARYDARVDALADPAMVRWLHRTP